MPKFVLNGKENPTFESLDAFTRGYIEAVFFTEEESLCEESGRTMPAVAIGRETMESRFVGGGSPGFEDLAPETLESIIADCAAFQQRMRRTLTLASRFSYEGYAMDQAGRDFWFTRNGHGVGFWDRGLGTTGAALSKACGYGTDFPQRHAYIGDDGKVYLA